MRELSNGRKVVAIVQARTGSVRFPGKALAEFRNQTLLSIMFQRLSLAKTIDLIVLAVPEGDDNDSLARIGEESGIEVFRGDENDVLARFFHAARSFKADYVVRLTADCPLIDPSLIDECVNRVLTAPSGHVYTSQDFPDGFDAEVFSSDLLTQAFLESDSEHDREHVTPFIRRATGETALVIVPKRELEQIRLCLDEPVDLGPIQSVLDYFDSFVFSVYDVDDLARARPELFAANLSITRDEGSTLSTGGKLWRRARAVVAGGNMIFSKRPDLHSPERWPTYFTKTKGCEVWDMDGVRLIDFGLMGVGTNILGFCCEPVDEAVHEVVREGNLSSLNPPEEVFLAEKLVEMHPWASKVRFTRSGGEAGAVAVRLARSLSGKDKIAVCGYHGWHDWYLAANLASDSALDDHLLPGLSSSGVPRGLRGSVIPFRYNDLDSLQDVLKSNEIAAVVMEVERSAVPDPGFLQGVRQLSTRYGASLIFDECTSGFRRVLGGLHLHYGVQPDAVLLGKTLGNGFAINAIVGRENLMSRAEHTFISSVFWSERVGLAAGIAALKEMERTNAPERVHELGLRIRKFWKEIAASVGVNIEVTGIPAVSNFSLPGVDSAKLRTVITEKFLERGILAGTSYYASLPHEEYLESDYFGVASEVLGSVFESIRDEKFEDSVPNVYAVNTFGRLT